MLIVKLLGKRISFPIFKRKVEKAWARNASIQLIDVGNDFYFIKFHCREDYDFALTGGPWLIFDHYLTIHLRNLCLIRIPPRSISWLFGCDYLG